MTLLRPLCFFLLLAAPLFAASPIGTRHESATLSFADGSLAYIVGLNRSELSGLTAANYLQTIHPYDAEKTGTGDTLLCWAATASNMLAYTGWGAVNGYQTEDNLLTVFRNNFTDKAGADAFGIEWFLTGHYQPNDGGAEYDYYKELNMSIEDWSQRKIPGSGGYWVNAAASVSNRYAVAGHQRILGAADLNSLYDHLQYGYAVGLSIFWEIGGHNVTCWGMIRNADGSISLLISDSDNNIGGGVNAPDTLHRLPLVQQPDGTYYVRYGETGTTGFLEGFSYLLQLSQLDLFTAAGKLHLENRLGTLAAMNETQNSAVRIFDTVDDLNRRTDRGWSSVHGFAGYDYDNSRYNTGSHVDVHSNGFHAGLSRRYNGSNGSLITGAMFQSRWSNFDSTITSAAASGKSELYGGSVFLKYKYRSGQYADAAVYAGTNSTSYRSDATILQNYDLDTPYTGYSVGLGYKHSLSGSRRYVSDVSIRNFGMYGGDGAAGDLSFASLSSQRLRLAGRLSQTPQNGWASSYIGGGYEYEFLGSAKFNSRTLYPYGSGVPSLRGGTGIGEFGFRYDGKSFTADINLSGYIGKREGFSIGTSAGWRW